MDFKSYLESKKIDPLLFQQQEESLYDSLKVVFDQVSVESFTQQKLFLINPLRRKYTLKQNEELKVDKPKPKKPVIKPKPKPKI